MMMKDSSKRTNQQQNTKPVGLTAAAGYQIGVRRTLPVGKDSLWTLLTTVEGLPFWLGRLSALPLIPGQSYVTEEGITGEVRVVKLNEQLRLTWQPPGWRQASTVQIRLISSLSGKTTVSFHQEKLADDAAREQMKQHWEEAITRIAEHCGV